MPAALDSTMTVQVRCFAQLVDWMGGSGQSLMVPLGTTVQELIERLQKAHPKAAPLLKISRVAVDCEFVTPKTPLRDAQEVAVIPPVSGG